MPGRHPRNALNAKRVKALKEPGRYADGNGLYLQVRPSGSKDWMLRIVVQGRRRDIGLGSETLVTLSDARDLALKYRRIARAGGDPLEERRKNQAVPTFKEAAERVHHAHSQSWRNAKHRAQWINTLEQYVFPEIGNRAVDQVESADILRVLMPIWTEKPETARRVRQRIGTVLDWAQASGFRMAGNPAAAVMKGLPKQNKPKDHFKAIPYADLPSLLPSIREFAAMPSTKLALEFLILTAARTGEVIGADWSEIDTENKAWLIPGSRMKARHDHRVPLTDRCIEILAQARALDPKSEFVFPGRSPGKPLSNMAMLTLLKRDIGVNWTVHGMRSAFTDWASERTNFPREVCDMALAHTIKDKTEAAYRRGDLFAKRRELMEAWEGFVCKGGET